MSDANFSTPDAPLRFSCEGLTCERGPRELFSGLGFSLLEGGLLLVTGANGAGKSTLLATLAGLLSPVAGGIQFGDVPIRDAADYESTCIYLGHHNALKPEATVLENITFWARMRGEEMLIPAAIHYFGLEPYLDYPCGQLSQGWQRRVALTRLMTCPAPLWILDEPGSNLDREGQALLAELIRVRTRQRGIVIMAAHGEVAMHREVRVSVLDIGEFQTD